MYAVVNVASYIFYRYQNEYGIKIDEMKLHKLLYYVQRESFIQTGKPLFDEQFQAWKFGPVMVEIRMHYKNDDFHKCDLNEDACCTVDKVFAKYARTRSWSLSMMSHEEVSWKNARKGIAEGVNGNAFMSNDDIKIDAERVKKIRGIYEPN